MATKEVTIIHPDEFKTIPATPAALAAYDFASSTAGLELEPGSGEEADFISARNAKGEGWRDLDALSRFFEAAAKSIKECMKHAWNVGGWEDLPDGKDFKVSWSKQSYTYEWQDDAGPFQVVQDLIAKNLVTVEQLVQLLTVANISKAAGMTGEKLMEMYPQYICAKAKERTLSIK